MIWVVASFVIMLVASLAFIVSRSVGRDPIADALLAQYKLDVALLKEVRRVCGMRE